MGLLDEILKQLEEAQGEAQGRPRPQPRSVPVPRPERETDEDGAEWEEDEEARPGHAPHIPSRRVPEQPVALSEPEPVRTTVDSAPAVAPHLAGHAPAERIRASLRDAARIREALVVRDILGPPPGLRLMRRR